MTTFAQSATITITLPSVAGTMATLAGTETFSNKTLVSPTLTGTPLAPTAAALTGNTQIATTAYADTAVGVEATARAAAIAAGLVSPTFTGTPAAPTASPGTNTVQLATTAFSFAGIAVEVARAEAAEALLAPVASPTFTGIPKAPTASPGTNTTQVASTAYALAAAAAAVGVSSGKLVFGAVTVQWGNSITLGGSVVVTFGTAFSGTPSNVQVTSAQSNPTIVAAYSTVSATAVTVTSGSSSSIQFFWLVIGPT